MADKTKITAFRIVGWNEHFEKAQTRKCSRMSWVPFSNKHDGNGFRRIANHKDSCSIFAAWVLIAQVASKCPTRGLLVEDNQELLSEDLYYKTGFPQQSFDIAFKVLSAPKINWLEKVQVSSTGSVVVDYAKPLELQDRTGQDISITAESDETPPRQTRRVYSIEFDYDKEEFLGLKPSHQIEWAEAYPAVDVPVEVKRARQWLVSNPKKRKKDVRRFLVNWLGRAQERGGSIPSNRPKRQAKGTNW